MRAVLARCSELSITIPKVFAGPPHCQFISMSLDAMTEGVDRIAKGDAVPCAIE